MWRCSFMEKVKVSFMVDKDLKESFEQFIEEDDSISVPRMYVYIMKQVDVSRGLAHHYEEEKGLLLRKN